MRISASTLLLALPILGVAAEGAFDQYKAQFQNFLDSFGSYLPKANPQPKKAEAGASAEAKPSASAKKLEILTLDNWKQTLYAPVKADATKPEEWWLLVTGRNKTCWGRCLQVEAAYNETAAKLATLPKGPHLAFLNCDDQPVLCNSWSASTGTLWVLEMRPPPAKVDIYVKRLNLTTTTSKTLLDLYAQDSKSEFRLYEGFFHPFDGTLATSGLSVPFGYALWILNVVPSWAMMLIVSFISRTMMTRRMGNANRQRAGAPGPAAPAAGAAAQ